MIKIKCKNAKGNRVTTNLFSVSVDSGHVNKVAKGLLVVTYCNCRALTGRRISFITKITNEVVDRRNEMILTLHYEAVISERRLYCRIGLALFDNITLQNGHIVTFQ